MTTPTERAVVRAWIADSPSLVWPEKATLHLLIDELEAAEDRIDALRDEVGRLTRERDEWEANEQEQHKRAEAAEARIEHLELSGNPEGFRAYYEALIDYKHRAKVAEAEVAWHRKNVGGWPPSIKLVVRANLADELASYVEAQHQALMHPQLVPGCITCDLLSRFASLSQPTSEGAK